MLDGFLRSGPSRERALHSYRGLAGGYDASSLRSMAIRAAALEALAPAPGETVFDVACGTGMMLANIAARTGAQGRAIGIELSPEMAAVARTRIAGSEARAEVVETAVEELRIDARADAMLFCYTHDVLQSERAIAALLAHARPGCRFAVAGMCFLPWPWGWPVNLVKAWRARRYMTTFRGLRDPCAKLAAAGVSLELVGRYHLGTGYLAVGRLAR